MTKKPNFNSVFTKFLYETFPGDKSKPKDRNSTHEMRDQDIEGLYYSRHHETRARMDPTLEYSNNLPPNMLNSEIHRGYDDHFSSYSSSSSTSTTTTLSPPTVRDHGSKRYSIDSKLRESELSHKPVVDAKCLETYLSQIIHLEKEKRQIMLDRKTWKKRCIRAETEQTTQALEFEDKAQRLKERYHLDLEKLRSLHQERCEDLSSQVAQLTQITQAYKNQLLEHGIEPTSLSSDNNTLDEDRKFIEKRYKKVRQGRKQVQEEEQELDPTVEYLIQALGYEFNSQRVEMCQDSLEQTKLQNELGRKLELVTSVRKIRTRAGRFEPKPSNNYEPRGAIAKEPKPFTHSMLDDKKPTWGVPRIPSLTGFGHTGSFGRASLSRANIQHMYYQPPRSQSRNLSFVRERL
ncbi:hypothetical protein K7432_010099 [Basidiobolus ranarum]|uniref:Uncharacterized protein n=1 Tax=Basidiobolus ranarum TaxID=34480 RepID=A0ABR2WPD4_9FUNG